MGHDDYHLEPRLVAALAALNRQDYSVAIAALEAVKKQYGLQSWGITAHLYLVQAYAATAEFSQALALCDNLEQCSQAKVRNWVNQARPLLQQKAELSQSLPPTPAVSPPPTPLLERAVSSQSLRRVSPWRLWLTQLGSLAVLAVLGAWLEDWFIVQPLIRWLSSWYNLAGWDWAITWFGVGVTGLVIGIGYPWAWLMWLRRHDQLQPLDLSTLNTYSPESIKLWGRFRWSWQHPRPHLGLLPTSIPLIFSFGHLSPWIILSQGLVQQLSSEAIALLLTAELIQLQRRYTLLLGPMFFIHQVFYSLYLAMAHRGNILADRLQQLSHRQTSHPDWGILALHYLFYGGCCGLSAGSYGVVWLLTKIIAPASRLRFYFTDRATAALTGHPNGLSQALLQLTTSFAQAVTTSQEFPHPLSQYRLMLPVHPAAAVTFGSLQFPKGIDWVKLTAWERQNPLKDWFSLFSSHRFLGIRLQALSAYAQKWQLQPYLDFAANPLSSARRSQGWRQLTPLWGLVIGVGLAVIAWRGGEFALRSGVMGMQWWWFANLNQMLLGWGSLGLGLGILVRINADYPAINHPITDANLLKPLLENPTALPLDSIPVKLTGKLLATGGLENCWGQRLWLQTEVGLFQLRAWGKFGPFSHLWPKGWEAWSQQTIQIQGWWRRSEIPWIEVDQAQLLDQPNQRFISRAPYWTTGIVALLVLFGLYTFLLAT